MLVEAKSSSDLRIAGRFICNYSNIICEMPWLYFVYLPRWISRINNPFHTEVLTNPCFAILVKGLHIFEPYQWWSEMIG